MGKGLGFVWVGRLRIIDLQIVELVERIVRHRGRQIGQLVEALLALAHIPVQAFRKGVEPIGDLVLSTNAGHRIDGRGHSQAVAMVQLLVVAAVEGDA